MCIFVNKEMTIYSSVTCQYTCPEIPQNIGGDSCVGHAEFKIEYKHN